MIITLNTNTLNKREVDVRKAKVRAFLTINDKVLVAHYDDVILLPGGSVKEGESHHDAIIRELKEELGINYTPEELKPKDVIIQYQPEYITRRNEKCTREVVTVIYEGKFKGIDLENTNRTPEELEDHFYLELLSPERLSEILKEETENPRKKYFNEEIDAVTKSLRPAK